MSYSGKVAKKRKQLSSGGEKKKAKVDINCEKLIQLVEAHSFVWDKSSSSYKDNAKRIRAWKIISDEMKVPGKLKVLNKSDLM